MAFHPHSCITLLLILILFPAVKLSNIVVLLHNTTLQSPVPLDA
jgi:hypothetical protein